MTRLASEEYNFTISPGLYHFYQFGEIDLRTLSLESAHKLFKSGFPYLEKKPPLPPVQNKTVVKKISRKKKK